MGCNLQSGRQKYSEKKARLGTKKFLGEGHFTHWKKCTRFFRTIGFIRILNGFFLKTKGFLPKMYEIFGE